MRPYKVEVDLEVIEFEPHHLTQINVILETLKNLEVEQTNGLL